MRDHWRLRGRRGALVVHMPNGQVDKYQHNLISALNDSGVSSGFELRFTRSATLSLLLAPLSLVRARWRGARIIHLHWLHDFSLHWADSDVSRRVLRWWFGVWLLWTRILGFRLVWTAHNILPHERIFDNDEAARRMLVRRADAVIALNEYGRKAIKDKFGIDVAAVIPQGATLVARLPERNRARASLQLDPNVTTVVFVGRLARHKGVDLLLKALVVPVPRLAVRIAGVCSDRIYADELAAAARQAQAAGADVLLEPRQLTDEEYAARLSAGDFAIFPFRSITNSGSVISALSVGLPVLIPALDALSEFPDGAVMKWAPHDGAAGMRAVLEKATQTHKHERDTMRSVALQWASTRSWGAIGNATRSVYEQILPGDRN